LADAEKLAAEEFKHEHARVNLSYRAGNTSPEYELAIVRLAAVARFLVSVRKEIARREKDGGHA
jgi:hypothetical protein